MHNENPIEIYEAENGGTIFYFSHSDNKLTTGVLVLKPGVALPKHNRPLAIENLTQISGKCLMTLFNANNEPREIELAAGEGIRMPKGQWHIHANPYEEVSVTLFKAEGDISEIVKSIKSLSRRSNSNTPKNL